MKPPTQAFVHLLFLLFVVGQITQEVIAYHSGYSKNHHHEVHHQGHHEGHHHSPSHHGHHGPRAARTRREKDSSETAEGTVAPGDSDRIPCTVNEECSGLSRSTCDSKHGFCTCIRDYPILDFKNDVCVKEAKLNEQCQYNSECEEADEYGICGPDFKCICKDGFNLEDLPDVGYSCVHSNASNVPGVDPGMIGVLVGLALMFVIICVVLRLFAKARFRENRSIFNTPNPRLMNASLFKDSGVAGRRGSAMSAVSATGSAHAALKTPSPAKAPKTKSETTVAIENVD